MLDTPQITETAAQLAAVIPVTVPRAEMGTVMGPGITALQAALAAQGIATAGPGSPSAESPTGPLCCTRVFESVLGGSYVRLEARWRFGAGAADAAGECADLHPKGGGYEEIALFGAGEDGRIAFWSFTSDGKRS